MSTLTAVQQLILRAFVIEPEDKTAFAQERHREVCRQYEARNRGRSTIKSRAWSRANPERKKELRAKSRAKPKNAESHRQRANRYHKEHKESPGYCEKRAAYQRLRRENDPQYLARYVRERSRRDPEFKLMRLLRRRVYAAVKGADKSARTWELLGCTASEWRAHLEKQFRPGMTWENYGPVWHVDHIKPCASFDLTHPAQQRACFNWSNTQPLFAEENLKKNDKYDSSL